MPGCSTTRSEGECSLSPWERAGVRVCPEEPYSTSSRFTGAGSTATINGRVKLLNETRAWPGASLDTRFQRLSSMLPAVRCIREMIRTR